jgi:hypothetical protein
MATTTNFGWATPDDTDFVKDGAAAIRTLGSSIDTSLVDLKGGATGQVLSKTSATDMDFTWVTTDDANAIQNSIVDAKGDIVAASANDTPARLAVGANNTVLIADSAEATGLKWGGGWTTYTPTYQNFTLGNGTVTARYQQVGKTVNFIVDIGFGSTTSVTGALGVSLPANNARNGQLFNVFIADVGTANYNGLGETFGNFVYIRAILTNATYSGFTTVSSTVPMTWTTGDYFILSGSYEVA